MAPSRGFAPPRRRILLLVLCGFTLLTLDLSRFGPIGSAQSLVRDLLHPVVEVAGAIVSPFANAWNAVFDYDDLETQNRALQAELDQLRGTALEVDAEREAFRRLLAATEIPYLGEVERVTAMVVRRGIGNFDDDVITIDKGSTSGITTGMAVVTGAGMVGRVDRVDSTTATVQLLSDSSMVVGVRLTDNDEIGLGSTIPNEPRVFRIDRGLDWPLDGDLSVLPAVGTPVVTAGSSRYPAEIPIGRISAVESADDDRSMIVLVEMANDVTDLSYVTVLLAEGMSQIPSEVVVPSTSTAPAADAGEG
jgi:rod shape-determining protein MreC